MSMTASRVLIFLLACITAILGFSFIAEKISGGKDEVCLTAFSHDLCLRFFTVHEIFGIDDVVEDIHEPSIMNLDNDSVKVESEKLAITQQNETPDESQKGIRQTEKNNEVDHTESRIRVSDSTQFSLPYNNPDFWNEVFEHWENLEDRNELYRIVHYGDSQIEMDRMTAYIRTRLQSRFGGCGPGLLPPLQNIPAFTVKQEASQTWNRFISYGLPENKALHRNYGVTGMIFNFDSGYAHVAISARVKNDSLIGKFENVKVLTGRSGKNLQIGLSAKNNKHQTKIIPRGEEQLVSWKLIGKPSYINLSFTGDAACEVLGIAIDGDYGIAMDNIPWRGSSGTTFTSISKSSLLNSYNLLDVRMVIFQFGGNSVPYIKTEKSLQQFIAGFKKQLAYIKSIDTTLKILVIGPADMSYNNKGQMETYPMLEKIINEMQQAANETGAAYWSLYHAMGGKNSMVEWVEAYPALAAPDYIHYTPRGSEIISQVFYDAIEREYLKYKTKSTQ